MHAVGLLFRATSCSELRSCVLPAAAAIRPEQMSPTGTRQARPYASRSSYWRGPRRRSLPYRDARRREFATKLCGDKLATYASVMQQLALNWRHRYRPPRQRWPSRNGFIVGFSYRRLWLGWFARPRWHRYRRRIGEGARIGNGRPAGHVRRPSRERLCNSCGCASRIRDLPRRGCQWGRR